MITVEGVEVGDTETMIIGPQETDKEKNRHFCVFNRENEIEVTVWGSNDGETWEERGSRTINVHEVGLLVVGPTVYIVKLTGKTTSPDTTSIVDAVLSW